jgi:carboxyl-terminal processing protease
MAMKNIFILLVLLAVNLQGFAQGTNSDQAIANKDKKSNFESLELFNKVLHLVEGQYYRPVDREKLIQGALKGMLATLDPHSAYLDDEIFSKMQEDTQGEFGGLGIEVTQKDGTLTVITPIEDSPADKAGIKTGDRIVEINHESTLGLTLEEAVEKMRGKSSTKITVGVLRHGEDGIRRFTMTRETIQIKPVKSEILEDNYLFIRLSQFQKRSASSMIESIQAAKEKLKAKGGLKGIVLDLRSNPGGLLDEAVNVSSIFMKTGVVVSTEGRDPKEKEIRYVKKAGYKDHETPLAVLINGSSASASEIVAGALQDSGRGIIMGSQSFGKGSVQTVAKIDEKRGVKLTIAQYMTPKERKIQAIGITPDIMLDEVEAEWISSHKKESRFIREVDLRNHLTATIETEEEKKQRLERERQEREERVAKIKDQQEKEKAEKNADKSNVKVEYKDDFQVIQAVNFLKTFEVYKKL